MIGRLNYAFGEKKAGGEFSVMAGSAHGDGEGFTVDANFERLFAGEKILKTARAAVGVFGDLSYSDAARHFFCGLPRVLDFDSRAAGATPAILRILRQIDLAQDAADVLIGEVVDFFWAVVEGGHCGHDDGAGVVGAKHIFEMDAIQGRFADAEDEGAALFEADIAGAGKQIFGESVRNFCKGSRGAWNDDHGVDGGRAGSDGRAHVFIGEIGGFGGSAVDQERGKFFGILGDDVELGGDEAEARFANDQENLGDPGVGFEMLEDGAGVESAAGAGNTDGDGAVT